MRTNGVDFTATIVDITGIDTHVIAVEDITCFARASDLVGCTIMRTISIGIASTIFDQARI